ncbi:hypothetical protein K501DRAFT_193331 [Backusella circina FSU 941]|nr:hypothetical protein K501DRAFT_203869 [Backusella circina FSU 941]KAI8879579.1 hypothetical protein K501DRAFT_193331 [Backusella circina FSU 941]
MLLPWNVFITASSFFSARFSGSHSRDFQSYFSAIANSASFLFMTLLLWLRQKQKLNIDLSIPILLNALVFLFYLISVAVPIQPTPYFSITLFSLILTGLTTSAFQLTVMGDASKLLPKYMQAVMSGQGIAGVAVALTALITTILQDIFTPDGTAFFYFLSAFGVTLLTLLGRIVLKKLPPMEEDEIAMEQLHQQHIEPRNLSVPDIVRRSKGNIFTVIFIYIITLSLFPSVTSQVKPTTNSAMDGDVFTSLHFLLFNMGDWIGRTLPIYPLFQIFKVNILVSLTLARVVFVLIFAVFPIRNDVSFLVMIFIFAASNGWLTSLVFMAAPRDYQTQHDKELVGRVMSFALMLGLSLGGCFSFLLI